MHACTDLRSTDLQKQFKRSCGPRPYHCQQYWLLYICIASSNAVRQRDAVVSQAVSILLCPAVDGWVSGWVNLDISPKLSVKAYGKCQGLSDSSNREACLDCASNTGLTAIKTMLNGQDKPTRAETCSQCYGSSKINAER
jgi:hypothetical protein